MSNTHHKSKLRPNLLPLALSKIFPNSHPGLLHHTGILHRSRHSDLRLKLPLDRILQQLLQHPPQRLARPGLGNNPRRGDKPAQRSDGPNRLSDLLVQLFEQIRRRVCDGDESKGDVAFHVVRQTDHGDFGDLRVRADGLLDGARAQTVCRDVDDVVAARHDVHVAVFVDGARVARVEPAAFEALQVAFVEALGVVPERREARGRQGRAEHDVAHGSLGDGGAFVVYDADVEAWHRFAGGAWFDEQFFRAAGVGEVETCGGEEREAGHGRAGFGGPPVVDDMGFGRAVFCEEAVVHFDDGGFAALACEE